MANDLVSIIIPAYNRANFLKNITLPSVMQQTYAPLECIVVDDGSTDDTKAVVEASIGNGTIPVQYIFQQNKGQGAARNTAITRARGKWILPLDSDDALLPSGVATLVDVAQKTHADIVWARTWRVTGEHKKILGIGDSTPSSVLLSKRIFDDYGLYDEDRNILEDVDHLYRLQPLLAIQKIKLVRTEIPSSIYFIHGGQSTSLENPAYLLRKANAMLKKWESPLPHNGQWKENMARWWRNKGSYEILMGNRDDGLRSLAHSLSFGFSLSTVILFAIALCGRRMFRILIIAPRHLFERIAFRISAMMFFAKHYKEAQTNLRELKNILQSSNL